MKIHCQLNEGLYAVQAYIEWSKQVSHRSSQITIKSGM